MSHSLEAELQDAHRRIRELEEQVRALKGESTTARKKLDVMSDEVIESNPYRYSNDFKGYYY